MLWDIIRDWFVQYVWGGSTSTGEMFGGHFARFMVQNGDNYYYMNKTAQDTWFQVGSHYINFGDWASTLSTIAVLLALVVFLFFVVRYLFRLTSGLIRGR